MPDHGNLYKCEDCEQAYAHANLLAAHRKSHEWTPQTCPTCDKEFSKRASYRAHLKLHDEDRQRMKCPYWGCNKDYSGQAVLNRHIKTVRDTFAHQCALVIHR